jgi:hypothetical protein
MVYKTRSKDTTMLSFGKVMCNPIKQMPLREQLSTDKAKQGEMEVFEELKPISVIGFPTDGRDVMELEPQSLRLIRGPC